MKRLLLLCATGLLSACASGQPALYVPQHVEAANAIRKIEIDCEFGFNMMYQLEEIVADPRIQNAYWDPLFAQVSGVATPAQRRSSAKYIMWSIRTQCQGY